MFHLCPPLSSLPRSASPMPASPQGFFHEGGGGALPSGQLQAVLVATCAWFLKDRGS